MTSANHSLPAMLLLNCLIAGLATLKADADEGSQQPAKDLKQRESQVIKICDALIPSVVAVNGASGVIISEDGLILSQYHVSHVHPKGTYKDSVPPGHEVKIIFADGRESVATLLGADRENDLSLLKLVAPGPYPYVRLDPAATVGLGDWVIKLGHPGGYQLGRPPVVRLGKVVRRIKTEFITDCHTISGDSGGPYFDLRGRLVGIIFGGAVPRLALPAAMKTRVGDTWRVVPAPVIDAKIDPMRRGELTSGSVRDIFQLYEDEKTLDIEDWTHGRRSLNEWRHVIAGSRQSVVKLLDGERQVALGTIVDSRGSIVTKASALPKTPKCVLNDGTILPVTLAGTDPDFDIAVLHTSSPVIPADWAELPQPLGSFVASVGHHEVPLAVGVVSVARRNLKEPFPGKDARPNETLTMFEHDAPVAEHECGGPLLNLDGRATDVTIARAGEHGCWAIPADCIRRIVDEITSKRGN